MGACGRLRPTASSVVASVPVRSVAEYPHCDAAIDTAHPGLADDGRTVTLAAMCGRFTLRAPWEEVAAVFALDGPARNLRPRYNTAPSQPVAAVRAERAERQLAMLR